MRIPGYIDADLKVLTDSVGSAMGAKIVNCDDGAVRSCKFV